MVVIFVAVAVLIFIAIENNFFKKRVLKGIEYKCYFTKDEVYEGEELELVEEIKNTKKIPVPWLRSDFTTSKYLEFAETRSVVTYKSRYVASFFTVKGQQRVVRHWKVKTTKRGYFSIDTVALAATDLLGGDLITETVDVNINVTVLPMPVEYNDFPINSNHEIGDTEVKYGIVSDPFLISGVREYQNGDSMKNINWNATAKTDKLMVHKYGFSTSPSTKIILNVESSKYDVNNNVTNEDSVELGIKIAATVLFNTISDKIPVSIMANTLVNNEQVSTLESFGNEHILKHLRLLASINIEKNMEFDKFLKQYCNNIKASNIYIITSYLSEEIIEFALNNPNTVIFLTNPDEDIVKYETLCKIVDLSYLKSGGALNAKE